VPAWLYDFVFPESMKPASRKKRFLQQKTNPVAGPNHITGTGAGTIGGTITALLANINGGDVLKTVILSAVGATVSFCLTFVMKEIVKSRNHRQE
jgi:hypothetical protein